MKNLYQNLLIVVLLISAGARAQIPLLNSYPEAKATVLLDFDGQYISGTSWNWSGPLTLGPANMSSDQVREVFNRVAEDYRPFNINITTDSTKYLNAPIDQRMRIILTISSEWYGAAGGVSYVNSFIWGDNTPAFVFTALLNYKAKNVAEAASHEIGHTLGLRHQSAYDGNCVRTAEYNAGAGAGEIGWAPIMGVGYYRNFTLWNNGPNPYGCTSYQDDLGIITGNDNGFGYRPDDYSGNPTGGATSASFINNAFTINGIIEKITDQDAFKFTIPALGYFHLDAIPYNIGSNYIGSNLDIEVELLSQGQTILGIFNPENSLSSSVDTMLEAGTYYIRVKGRGNMYAPEYASLGSYSINGSYIGGGALPVRKLQLQGSIENRRHTFSWIIDADETVTSQVLEVSPDGRNYQPVSTLLSDERTYAYLPHNTGILNYRLKVNFDNGHFYYSNVVVLKNTGEAQMPTLVSNLIRNSVSVNSPATFSYTIYSFNGVKTGHGLVSQGNNTIDIDQLSRGMYIIRFTNEMGVQYAEKFMKQ